MWLNGFYDVFMWFFLFNDVFMWVIVICGVLWLNLNGFLCVCMVGGTCGTGSLHLQVSGILKMLTIWFASFG